MVFSMISNIFFPAQLFNIHLLSINFVHIKSLDFILQFISILSHNTGSFAIGSGIAGDGIDIFADVILFPRLCSFVLSALAQ